MSEDTIKTDNPAGQQPHSMSTMTASATWMILVAATLLSWWLAGDSYNTDLNSRAGEHTAVIGLAVVKMYLVLAVFMGIWKSPLKWHTALAGTLAVTGCLLIFFVVSP